ncbi:hypothetical protein EHS25_003719 [Saitozyma podzolica]|uniref:Asl1-like glycosyl hydrolase catalytic domain-containing protein n=1 Tax=Saitozyma podzolica TaxID=1890683 RepID=A0A427Y396_9TREE|nr:hypothetical protein EHS25_003719 [Saitozyma podzolica]
MWSQSIMLLSLASVALATPAPLHKRGSGKAGISWPVQEGSAIPVELFFGSGSSLTWWWDWNMNYGSSMFPDGVPTMSAEFVPMYYDESTISSGATLQAGFSMAMGYNEPDQAVSGVSIAIPATAAAANWPAIRSAVLAANPSAKLISPTPAGDVDWLVEFFNALCPGQQSTQWSNCADAPDIIGMHAYATDFDGLTSKVESFYSTFGRPIIVSEFAMANFAGFEPTQQEVYDFMGQTTLWFDQQDYVINYAWFGAVRDSANLHDVPETNRLMAADGTITPLGQQYINGGHD